jgi:hypothetical protein
MKRSWFCALTLLWLTAAGSIAEEPQRQPADLLSEGDLQVNSRLVPDNKIVPGQKLALELEVATTRWFAGGTRINLPEVPGLVILQTESFASNATEQRNGESWVVQRWTVDIYPQREGAFVVPPVALMVQVNDALAGTISGVIRAPGVRFKAEVPAELARAQQWVAAPSFGVSQTFDRDLQALAVGDAIEREIRFEASDVMAMMLPGFDAEDLSGLKAYPLPPELKDSNNRGEMIASRVERISYIAQQPGSYTLPAVEFLWWDTRDNSLALLSLPAVDIQVSGGANQDAGGPPINWPILAAGFAGLLILVLVLWLTRRWLRTLPWQWVLDPVAKAVNVLRSLRQPVLPTRLNPDSSAAD